VHCASRSRHLVDEVATGVFKKAAVPNMCTKHRHPASHPLRLFEKTRGCVNTVDLNEKSFYFRRWNGLHSRRNKNEKYNQNKTKPNVWQQTTKQDPQERKVSNQNF